MAAMSTTISPAIALAEKSNSDHTEVFTGFLAAYWSPRCTFPMIAFEENVAPDTASTFIFWASSIVLPFHLVRRAEASVKKSGLSELASALILFTLPSCKVISNGTMPP